LKIYIAGKITGDPQYKKKFSAVEEGLKKCGHKIMNPAILPEGFEHHEYMQICRSMLEICEAVYFLEDWEESMGALKEYCWAKDLRKNIIYQGG